MNHCGFQTTRATVYHHMEKPKEGSPRTCACHPAVDPCSWLWWSTDRALILFCFGAAVSFARWQASCARLSKVMKGAAKTPDFGSPRG
ncbi:hypothetical protein KM043_017922 [Ampulex compressa]|nr:hypothetical protein KM043_017922 [Ampulex compressa]